MEDKFLTLKEASQLLKLSVTTINRLIKNGQIPSYKVGESRLSRRLFDRDELIDWVKSHRNGPGVPKKKDGKNAKKKGKK